MHWLENPPRKKRATKKKRTTRRKPPGGYRSWKSYMAHLRTLRKGANPVATKKKATRRKSAARKTTTTRRRRRRNPPRKFSVKGIVKKATTGIGNAVAVTGGKVAARGIPQKIEESRVAGGAAPFSPWARAAVQAGVAVATGLAADMLLGAKVGEFILAGALSVPVETTAVQLNIPFVSEQLSGVGRYLVVRNNGAGVRGVGAYDNRRPKALSSGMGRYLRSGTGAVPDPVRPGIPGVRSALGEYFSAEMYG